MTRVSHPQKATRRRWFGLSRNNRGSVLLLVIIAAPVAAALFFSLIEMVLISKRQAVINRNMVSYSAVLDAVIDYTNYGIKNRWCMTDTWTRDTTNCNLNHPRSFERMTLDQNAITALRDINSANPGFSAANAVLDQVSVTINVSDLINQHPLASVAKNLEKIGKAVTQIGVTVKRINNTNVPRRGREVYLDVKVTLMSGSVIFRNLSAISATSRLMVTPRELNYFSLIVPRDMYIDGTSTGASGDFSIPSGTGGTGISFESPIFINGDLHIPNQTSGGYTSTTFSNKVILGGPNSSGTGGRIMQGSTPYSAPNSGDMSSYLYSVMKNFGGFKKGVDVDGERDGGLDVLAGYTAAAADSPAAANQCIGINDVYYKLQKTKDSDLVLKPKAVTPAADESEIVFYMGLTRGNMFVGQELRPQFVTPSQGKGVIMNTIDGTKSTGRLRSGQSTMYFRFDAGPDLNTLGSTATPPTGNQFTEQFTLHPNTKATMIYTATAANGAGAFPTAKIDVELVPVVTGGTPSGEYERDVVEVHIRSRGYQNPTTIQYFSLYVKGYDLGYFGGRQMRNPLPDSDPGCTQTPGHSTDGWLYFKLDGGTPGSRGVTAVNGKLKWIKRDGSDWGDTNAYPLPVTNYIKLEDSPPTNPAGYSPPYFNPGRLDPIFTVPTGVPISSLPDETQSYQAYVKACTSDAGGSNSTAFKAIGWNSPFVNSSRYSWHFAPDNGAAATPADAEYTTIPASGPGFTINNGAFNVKSIVGNCVIPPATTVAAGFYTCDNLIIQPRGAPLLMIGTFIVGRATIDPSAVSSGITFRSIYHPQSLSALQSVGAMTTINGSACPSPLPFPIWWPGLTSDQYDMFRKCNVISLRDIANPFTWSSANPDCGVSSASNFTQCQKHTLNYILSEISRTSELQ